MTWITHFLETLDTARGVWHFDRGSYCGFLKFLYQTTAILCTENVLHACNAHVSKRAYHKRVLKLQAFLVIGLWKSGNGNNDTTAARQGVYILMVGNDKWHVSWWNKVILKRGAHRHVNWWQENRTYKNTVNSKPGKDGNCELLPSVGHKTLHYSLNPLLLHQAFLLPYCLVHLPILAKSSNMCTKYARQHFEGNSLGVHYRIAARSSK